ESVELVHHGIDGVLQFQNFALHVHGDFAGEVATRHGGGDLGNISNLTGEVSGHGVDRIGQVFPGSGDAGDVSLAAEAAFAANFARNAGDFTGEGVELVHHGVDGFFEK